MKRHFSLLIFVIFVSCGMNDQIKNLHEIDRDIKTFLGTENVNTTLNWGSEPKDNFLRIDLVEYNFESKSYEYLDSLSNVIKKRVSEKFPESVKSKFIQIRYTKDKDADSAKNVVSFKY